MNSALQNKQMSMIVLVSALCVLFSSLSHAAELALSNDMPGIIQVLLHNHEEVSAGQFKFTLPDSEEFWLTDITRTLQTSEYELIVNWNDTTFRTTHKLAIFLLPHDNAKLAPGDHEIMRLSYCFLPFYASSSTVRISNAALAAPDLRSIPIKTLPVSLEIIPNRAAFPSPTPTIVPEPPMFALWGIGVLIIGMSAKKIRRRIFS